MSWPLQGTEQVLFYVHSRGHANSLKGDGRLSTKEAGEEPADQYRYGPAAPIRIFWTPGEGPVDERPASTRDVCLCYMTEPRIEPLDAAGLVSPASSRRRSAAASERPPAPDRSPGWHRRRGGDRDDAGQASQVHHRRYRSGQ